MIASDEDIYSLNGKTSQGGLNSPVPILRNIFPMLVFHSLHQWTPSLQSHFMHFLTYAYLPHHRASCLDSFLFTHPKFYIIFIYLQPNFHSVFCLVFFHLITEFELDLYDISSRQRQIRALNFCSFTVWLASIWVQPQVNKNKPKEDHQLHCPLC